MLRNLAPLALSLGLLAGCALATHPRIADLKSNPGRYQNRSVGGGGRHQLVGHPARPVQTL
jgi:hypothetical protein